MVFAHQIRAFSQGTLKDSLDRYSLYGLEENTSYESNFKSEIEEVTKLVSIHILVFSDCKTTF